METYHLTVYKSTEHGVAEFNLEIKAESYEAAVKLAELMFPNVDGAIY